LRTASGGSGGYSGTEEGGAMSSETTIAPIAPMDDAQRSIPPEVIEKVVLSGDLSELNAGVVNLFVLISSGGNTGMRADQL